MSLASLRQSVQEKEGLKTKEQQKRKFDRLLCKQRKHQDSHRNRKVSDRVVVNLSSKELTESQRSILAKGLNFAISPREIPTRHIVANVESAIRVLPQRSAEDVRLRIAHLLRNAKRPPCLGHPVLETVQ